MLDDSWVVVETETSEVEDRQTDTEEDKVDKVEREERVERVDKKEREERDDWTGQTWCKYV